MGSQQSSNPPYVTSPTDEPCDQRAPEQPAFEVAFARSGEYLAGSMTKPVSAMGTDSASEEEESLVQYPRQEDVIDAGVEAEMFSQLEELGRTVMIGGIGVFFCNSSTRPTRAARYLTCSERPCTVVWYMDHSNQVTYIHLATYHGAPGAVAEVAMSYRNVSRHDGPQYSSDDVIINGVVSQLVETYINTIVTSDTTTGPRLRNDTLMDPQFREGLTGLFVGMRDHAQALAYEEEKGIEEEEVEEMEEKVEEKSEDMDSADAVHE